MSGYSCFCQSPVSIGYFSSANDTIKGIAGVLAGEIKKAGINNIVTRKINTINEATIVLAPADQLVRNGYPATALKNLKGLASESIGIVGNGKQVILTGNSCLGVQHAAFRYLYLLGFRYYFPQEEWFIYPEKVNVLLKTTVFATPSFNNRRLWYAYGTGSDIVWTRYAFWEKANCLLGEMNANVGHSYDQIVERNKATFLKHPEWLSNTTRAGVIPDNPKFDITKPDLVKLVIEDSRNQIETLRKANSPAYKMISLSPSDGIGICDTKECRKIGTITDRVFYLINTVARNIRNDYPSTFVGCLAYSEYIAPPTAPVADNVYVSLTTAFNESKYSMDELMTLWKKKVRQLGIYDYQALYAWDYDLPGQAMASAYHTIAPAIKKYSRLGLKGYEAEINTGWIGKGLGYYLTSQLLWNTAVDDKKITDAFFNDCFRSSAPIAKKLFTELSRFNDPFISQPVIARWIDLWVEALQGEKDTRVTKRLEMVGNYLQYLVFYNNLKANPGEANLRILMEQAKLHLNDESVTYYPAMLVLSSGLPGFNVNEVLNQNKTRAFTYSAGEVRRWLTQYRSGLKKPVEYARVTPGKKLINVPGGKEYALSLHDVREDQNSYIGTTYFVFRKEDDPASYFEAQGDFIEGGGRKQPVEFSVFPFVDYNPPTGKALVHFSYADRKKWNRYSLKALKKGLYVLKVDDPRKGFQLRMSPDIAYSLFMPEQLKQQVGYIHSLYFYVPATLKSFKFLKTGTLKIIDPKGKVYDYGKAEQAEVEITPDKNQTGIWRLMYLAGFIKTEGFSPVFGIIPSRMLYPQD